MKRVTHLGLAVAFAVCTLWAQELPFGVAGERGLELRALSHRVAPTRIPVTWSACGTARVDGILSPGEWSGATSQVITVNTAAGAVPATLYVMNDNLTLYNDFFATADRKRTRWNMESFTLRKPRTDSSSSV